MYRGIISLFLATALALSFACSSGGGGGDENTSDDGGAGSASATSVGSRLIRNFKLPIPLFSSGSAWRQRASAAAVLSNSDAIIAYTYGVLTGNGAGLVNAGPANFPNIYMNYDEYTVPVFLAGSGTSSVTLCEYEGAKQWPSPKFGDGEASPGGPITVPTPAGTILPALPVGIGSDGWLVLFDQGSGMSYDFWQATTQRNGECQSLGAGYEGSAIVEAGYADFFDLNGDGSNADGLSSAKAAGTPLLAGLLLPEDIVSGAISHALTFAIPGPRNLSGDPSEPSSSEYDYPASTTEAQYYSVNQNAMIAGQRIRLKGALVDENGGAIDESGLAPVTRMFLTALREYGAYMLDNAGGFIFYAEDISTGNLDVSDAQVSDLIGRSADADIASGKSKWQVVAETLNEELASVPISSGSTSNFDVVTSASKP